MNAKRDSEDFAKTLRDAKAVWFNGRRQWNCVDFYMTKAPLISISIPGTAADDLLPMTRSIRVFRELGSPNTAIIVNGSVRGHGQMESRIPREPWKKPFFVLSAGDVHNMKTRSIEKYGIGNQARISVGAKQIGDRQIRDLDAS